MKTMIGYSRKEWHEHVDMLFDVAHEGEDIPESALLFFWPVQPTARDLDWARTQLAEIITSAPKQ